MTTTRTGAFPEWLADEWGIRVLCDTPPSTWGIPSPAVLRNTSSLRAVLRLALRDWEEAVAAEERIGPSPTAPAAERLAHQIDSLHRLTPRYLTSLLTYLQTFFMLDQGYTLIFAQLKELNRELCLHLKPPKDISTFAYHARMRHVRNNSFAHWASRDKDIKDKAAGQDWGLHFKCEENGIGDLRKVEFGAYGVTGARPRHLPSLRVLHEAAYAYLRARDGACLQFLCALRNQLPRAIGGRHYEAVPKTCQTWTWDDPA